MLHGVTSVVELLISSNRTTHECSIKSRVIDINVIEPHRCSVHNIDGPKWTLNNRNCMMCLARLRHVVRKWYIQLTVLNKNIRHIPKHKGHWSTGLCITSLGGIPRIATAVDLACSVAVNVNPLPGDDESRSMVLERYWV